MSLSAIVAAIAGAALLLGAKVGAWWRDRKAAKERAELKARAEDAETKLGAAVGELEIARVNASIATEHAEKMKSATTIEREIKDAAATDGDRIGAVDEWVRKNANRSRKGSGGTATPPVRRRKPSGSA